MGNPKRDKELEDTAREQRRQCGMERADAQVETWGADKAEGCGRIQ